VNLTLQIHDTGISAQAWTRTEERAWERAWGHPPTFISAFFHLFTLERFRLCYVFFQLCSLRCKRPSQCRTGNLKAPGLLSWFGIWF